MSGPAGDTAHLSVDVRARLTATYRRLRTQSGHGCVHDGEILLFGVPRWVTRAYVLAVHTARDPVKACLAAHFGDDHVVQMAERPDWDGWMVGRQWASRLADLDRTTRMQEVA